MADVNEPSKELLATTARGSDQNKPKSSSRGKTPAKHSEKQGPSGTSSTSKSSNRDGELLSILLAVRNEQANTTKKLESFDQRIKELETSDHTQYDYDPNYGYYEGYEEFEDDSQSQNMGDKLVSVESDNNNNDKTEESTNSRFASLAKKFKAQEVCDGDVDPELAENVNTLFREGMQKEKYDAMIKEAQNSCPQNCQGLVTVRLNQLVWDIVSPSARTKDGKLQAVETAIVKSASIMTKTVDKADKMERECKQNGGDYDIGQIIDRCNDAVALLGHANTQINMLRRDLLKPEMRNEYSHLCTHSLPFTDQLFGDDVSKTAKEIEECSRMGHKLQYGPMRGNFRGRFGYRPRYRGGFHRGGYRGRGGMDSNHPQQMPKNFPRRGGVRKM